MKSALDHRNSAVNVNGGLSDNQTRGGWHRRYGSHSHIRSGPAGAMLHGKPTPLKSTGAGPSTSHASSRRGQQSRSAQLLGACGPLCGVVADVAVRRQHRDIASIVYVTDDMPISIQSLHTLATMQVQRARTIGPVLHTIRWAPRPHEFLLCLADPQVHEIVTTHPVGCVRSISASLGR